MPNYCNNTLTLTHEDPQMIVRAFNALETGELLQEFIPVPAALKETMSGAFADEIKQAELEAQTKQNIATYGYGNWYDYCCGEWGTKWDIGEQGCTDVRDDGLMLVTSFDSAWSPPLAAYEKLQALGFGVNAMYYESGMAFAGAWEDGIDDYYDLSGMDSLAVADALPSYIDEAFAISEGMSDWEAENEEEEELTEWIKEGAEARKESL